MTTQGQQFSIDGSAVKIISSSNHYQSVVIHTDGAIYIGDSNAVSTSTGFKLDVGTEGEFMVAPYSELWAISNGGTTKTTYLLVTVI